MDRPRVANATDFVVTPTNDYGRDGEVVVAIVKSTWVLSPAVRGRPACLVLAPPGLRRDVRQADVPWGDPALSSVRYPADRAIEKAGTDVVLVADACAPGGEVAAHIDVKAQVGPLEVLLRAHGPRAWRPNGEGATPARPTARVPLRWELAFGGRQEVEPGLFVEDARNPCGRGVVGDLAQLGGTPAPQIEDVAAPMGHADARPVPAGVGAVARHWEPRRGRLGTYDAAWHEGRSPLPPLDQDPRHAILAAPGLHASTPFVGGEAVVLVNLSPREPVLHFALPRLRLEIAFEVRGVMTHRVVAPVDTVLLDLLPADDDAPVAMVELVHRAHVPAPRRQRDLVLRVRELPVIAARAEASA